MSHEKKRVNRDFDCGFEGLYLTRSWQQFLITYISNPYLAVKHFFISGNNVKCKLTSKQYVFHSYLEMVQCAGIETKKYVHVYFSAHSDLFCNC